MLSRNQSQEKMMTSIYNYLFNQKNGNDLDIKTIIEASFEADIDEVDVYSKEVIVKSLLNQDEINKEIEDNLSEKIKFNRLNMVAHAILILAIGQYRYVGEIKKSEMINISVELAKKYLDDGEYRFINAVLDKIL